MAAFIEALIETFVIDDKGRYDQQAAIRISQLFYVANLGNPEPGKPGYSAHQNMLYMGYPIIPYIPLGPDHQFVHPVTVGVLRNNFRDFGERMDDKLHPRRQYFDQALMWGTYPIHQITFELLAANEQIRYSVVRNLYSKVYSVYDDEGAAAFAAAQTNVEAAERRLVHVNCKGYTTKRFEHQVEQLRQVMGPENFIVPEPEALVEVPDEEEPVGVAIRGPD